MIILNSKQNMLQNEAQLLSFTAFCYTDILVKVVWNKSCLYLYNKLSLPLLVGQAKTGETCGEIPFKNVILISDAHQWG